MSIHRDHMAKALKIAKYALDHGETPVACIFVHIPSNKVIGYGMNDTNNSCNGVAHAEFMGIEQIKNAFGRDKLLKILEETALYVTVEPCIMCASAMKQLGIAKVIFGCGNDRFGGNGTVVSINTDKSTLSPSLKNPTYEALPGVLRREAIMLLRYFYVKENERSPNPRIKLDRKLDKDTFPPILWSKYVDRKTFGQEFGTDMLTHFDDNTDLEEINWQLIDSAQDDILNILDRERNSFTPKGYKKLKT